MKSIFKYILCTCVAVTATSCDFLDVVPTCKPRYFRRFGNDFKYGI